MLLDLGARALPPRAGQERAVLPPREGLTLGVRRAAEYRRSTALASPSATAPPHPHPTTTCVHTCWVVAMLRERDAPSPNRGPRAEGADNRAAPIAQVRPLIFK